MAEFKYSVLFVCMGNICRSPTAEGVFRHHVKEAGLDTRILVDSAGTHAYHSGEPADRRAQAAASRRGISLEGIRARRVADEDFVNFDHILVMDQLNLATLEERAPEERKRGTKMKCPIHTTVARPDSSACWISWKKRLKACSRRFAESCS
jgi:protein-tyrosine phosphatase